MAWINTHKEQEALTTTYPAILDEIISAGEGNPFPEVLSQRLVNILSEGLSAERVSVFRAETGLLGNQVLTLQAATGLEDSIIRDIRQPIHEGIPALAMEEEGILHLTNDEASRKSLGGDGYFGDLMVAQLKSDSTPLGVISVTNKQGGGNFSTLAEKVFSYFVKSSSLVLGNAIDREMALQGYGKAVELKDGYTAQHQLRVAQYALLIAQQLGLPGRDLNSLGRHAVFHDVGKIGVPEHILNKNGKLTDDEFTKIQRHTTYGQSILASIDDASEYALHHHERWDGTGYPDKLAGEDISIPVRVLSVADAFDAMTSDRPYRQGMGAEKALEIVGKESGTQFWPEAAQALLTLYNNGQRVQLEQIMATGVGNPDTLKDAA